ncbi:GvpT/GvpP family gas vesicle accessory protein [Peribacillus kribbensis]|uniref:GvpT/GvpP family gas vesicle accessory protein n=1 Tax=Peribacillus kribbensis TaxID=356658 RepID=UPI0004260D2C|nr:GvpT/GvpP family gas vesicle accessory protein [Peribacillus kribbensis]
MENTKNENQNQETNERKVEAGSVLKRSLAGALIGAAAGYLATPENGKKLIENISAHKLKNSGASLGQAVKKKSKKASASIKEATAKLFHRKEYISIEGYSNEQDDNSENETSLKPGMKGNSGQNEEQPSKKENAKKQEDLNERLGRLEKMMSQLGED